jgi:predicted negative regulator of RcsB-dependent stress response
LIELELIELRVKIEKALGTVDKSRDESWEKKKKKVRTRLFIRKLDRAHVSARFKTRKTSVTHAPTQFVSQKAQTSRIYSP